MADDTQEGRQHQEGEGSQDDAQPEQRTDDGATGEQDSTGQDDADEGFDALPAKTQAEIRRLRKEAETTRRSLRSTEAERDQAKALAEQITKLINGDEGGEPDAEKLAAQIADKDAELRAMRVERAAEKAIRKHSGDADALLDSRTFADKLGKLDPADDGFADELDTLVKETVASNDRYKAAPPQQGSGTTEHSAGSGTAGSGTSSIDAMRKRFAGIGR